MDEVERNANGQEPMQEHQISQPTFDDISNHFRQPETNEGFARIDNFHFLNFLQPANNQVNFDGNHQLTNENLNFDGNNGEVSTDNNQMNVANANFDGVNQMEQGNANLNCNDQNVSDEDKNQIHIKKANNEVNGNESNTQIAVGAVNPDFGFLPPAPMSFCPIPFPPMDVQYNMPMPPMGGQFNVGPPWGGFQQQMMSVPPGYMVGPPPPDLAQYEQLPRHFSQGWNRFEAPKVQQRMESFPLNFSGSKGSDSRCEPWWKSRLRPQYSTRYGPGGGNYGGSFQEMQQDERFNAQLSRFPNLPIEIHRRIGNMSAYEITANFEVYLVRLRANCIIEATTCHVVFTKKPDTEQCWLMAVALTDDHRTYIKFNRLLTSHLKVKVNGSKAVELTPAKVGPENEEVYVFNFTRDEDATNFINVLDKGRNQVWIHIPPPPSNYFMEEQYFQPQFYPIEPKPQRSSSSVVQHVNAFSDRRPYRSRRNRKGVDSSLFLNSLRGKFWPDLEAVEQQRSRAAESGEQSNANDYGELKFVKFKAKADIFHKCGSEYSLLASGEMNVVSHDGSYDEIVFVRSKKVVFHHEIFQWHRLRFEKYQNVYGCKWVAAIYLAGSKGPFPAPRELKMEVTTEPTLSEFFVIFHEAVEKAITLTNVPVV